MPDEWTIFHFSQSNPTGTGQGDVSALLRRVADTIDELGEIEIMDITFTSIADFPENDLSMTVYYGRPGGP